MPDVSKQEFKELLLCIEITKSALSGKGY